MKRLINARVSLLKDLNRQILETGEEDIFEYWFSFGVPDEASQEDYEELAQDIKTVHFIIKTFETVMNKKA